MKYIHSSETLTVPEGGEFLPNIFSVGIAEFLAGSWSWKASGLSQLNGMDSISRKGVAF
jgi:hypothetical protein